MTTEDELKAQTIVESWYWQMAEGHNFRWKNAVKSMVLFYESAPLESDVAQLVIEYLRTRSGVTRLLIGNKPWTFAEPGWNTKDAWYQTVPSEQWAGTESKKVRLYWVLVEAGDGTADGPYTVENGCKYLVTHSYYWDVAGEPQLPASESGVQYSIQGFTRDRETGLFTYIVEKRETVEQSIPLYESAKTIFETVSEQQFLGVKQGSVAGKGLQASVGNGERVERHVEKNPDCTSDIKNRKIKDTKVEQSRTVVRKDLRGTSAAVTDRNLTPGEAAAKTAAVQEVGETRTVEKTDTDLRNVTVEKFTPGTLPMTLAESCERETSVHTDTKVEAVDVANARPVEQTAEPNKRKTVSYKKNDDGKTADKTTTTQTWEEKTGGGSSDSGGGVVTTTTERKENTVETPSAVPGVNKVVEIEETPNDHGSKTTVKRVTEYREKTGGGSSDSGGGVVTSTTERKENTTTSPTATPGVNKVVEIEETPNDHGSKTTVKRVTVFKPDSKTATGGSAGYTDEVEIGVNQTSVPGGAGSVNKVVDVSVSMNDHGSMSTQKRTRTYHPDSKKATGGSASYTDEVESGVNQTSVPGGAGGVNKVVDVSVSLNDHGSMSTQKRTRTYHPDSKTATGGSASYTDEVESGVNQTSVPGGAGGVNKVVDVSVSLNDHGSMSTQKRTRTYHPDSKKATGGSAGYTDEVESGVNQTSVPGGAGGVNKVVDVSVSLNEHGSMSTQKRTRTYLPQVRQATSNFATEKAVTTVKLNATDDPTASQGAASTSPNEHGSATTQVTEYTPIPKDTGWITWQSVEESPTHIYTYECGIRVFKNLAAIPTPPGGSRVQVSPNINRYGLYDGSIAYSKLINWAQAGSGGTEGGSQAGSFQYTYVSDYQIQTGSNGDLTITPVFATATISTRTYYGRGNEGSEAQAAANSSTLPGVHLPHRTYITSSTTSIVQAMKRAEVKLQVALANRKARGT